MAEETTKAPRANREKPRAQETREAAERPKQWQPASLLPMPEPQEGYEFRYIRKSMIGVNDPTNMSRKIREGWETCRLEDHPELELNVDEDAKESGLVEIGGLILCKMPTEMVKQRNAYYSQSNRRQVESVDNNYMKEEDPRMPLISEKSSKVSFGGGRG